MCLKKEGRQTMKITIKELKSIVRSVVQESNELEDVNSFSLYDLAVYVMAVNDRPLQPYEIAKKVAEIQGMPYNKVKREFDRLTDLPVRFESGPKRYSMTGRWILEPRGIQEAEHVIAVLGEELGVIPPAFRPV